jgi:MMPL family
MTGRRNLAGAAGGWSSRHRRKAIVGWLVFVVGAYAIGGAIGQRHLTDAQMGNGQSGQATRIYQRAFPGNSAEQVLVQGRESVRAGSAGFAAAVRDLVGRLQALKTVSDVRSPLLNANRGLRSPDGRSMLITFKVAGDQNQAQINVDGALAATAATAKAYPQFRVEEFGAASSNKALGKAFTSDFHRAEYTSLR